MLSETTMAVAHYYILIILIHPALPLSLINFP
jgi:hypothetical protein